MTGTDTDTDSGAGVKAPDSAAAAIPAAAWINLALATVGMAVNFWAWGLISPLGPTYKQQLGLNSFQQSFLVAVPVLVGSLGRIPVGALTDKYGARLMVPAISFATVLPVLGLSVVHGFGLLLLVGFFLGVAGSFFAAGVPYVNSWFPPARRGMAIGIFGIGTGGTAIASFFTARFLRWYDNTNTMFYVVAVVLAVYGVVALLLARDAPGRQIPEHLFGARFKQALKDPSTLPMALLYAVCFGAFVAMGVYLPTYLKEAYHLSQDGASTRAAGFTLVAVLFRPLGGTLSDRIGPAKVLVGSFGTVGFTAVWQAFQPPLNPWSTVAFLVMAASIGLACGAVFALVAIVTPKERVGTVTGLVGAAGGLGGYFPPLVMGAVYGITSSFAIGLMLLSDAAFAALIYCAAKLLGRDRRDSPDRFGS
ncbi:NNP family nitrate/nitrite transporter-like MFS transporter [Streptacidiphilus sp. MAP12-20]|uniref:MFS transporter n=1 Tax=Streptacidiphilus sp. MAP12-20 TaxID=3156299 RepID=UPI003515B53A